MKQKIKMYWYIEKGTGILHIIKWKREPKPENCTQRNMSGCYVIYFFDKTKNKIVMPCFPEIIPAVLFRNFIPIGQVSWLKFL